MRKDISPRADGRTIRRARQLRRAMTLPEVLLWNALRGRDEGLKFRRQHPSGSYVIDFFCTAARLAVEIDGAGHDARAAHDAHRDAYFARAGIRTIRISAADVLRDLDAVVRGIVGEATARLPLHQPSAGPPPRDKLGEE